MAAREDHGRFVWFDLMTTEPSGAESFYGQLIGWQTRIWEGETFSYTMWANGDATLGGVVELPEEARAAGAPPHWLSYVAVDDVDATAARVEELGGSVLHPPTDIPSVGRFAVIRDPQGATLAVYRSASGGDSDAKPPEIGEFSWHELATADFEAAHRFYSELFGWEKLEAMDMGDAGIYQIYGRHGRPLGGMFNKPAEMPGPPGWLYYIRVEDVRDAADRVRRLGGQVLNGPMEVPGGDLIAQCVDPQGAMFALHSSAG
jgi:predicted enzyme related to lactoylglutathione lyase